MVNPSSASDRGGTPDALEELIVECLACLEDEGESALERLCLEHPDHADSLLERIAVLSQAGLLSPPAGTEQSLPNRLGEFLLVRRIGGGGMGVVYEAEQPSLGRRVALKILQPAQLLFPGSRERFQREVEAAARLNHPGIVPVYSVGEDQGTPFFAMELVDGASMTEVLGALEQRSPDALGGDDLARVFGCDKVNHPDSVFSGSWVEASLRIALQAAEALEHAHSRGVMHRDIKPSNIMLTPDGRALLVDFGLSSLSGSPRITRSGAQVGSAAYMPPENVDKAAASEQTGALGDVYSLGVTLYELLTLRLPYAAPSSTTLFRLILEGLPAHPRKRNRAVTADAETVCLTAMDRDPARRYRSAGAFARDLRNVLELRPLEARPASTALRFRRWVQRRPGWAMAAAVTLLALTLSPVIFGLQQRQSARRISLAMERAEANLADALGALEILTDVGEQHLRNVPQAEEARRSLLVTAREFYQRLYDRRRDDPALRLEAARARRRVGSIYLSLGESERANAVLAETVDLLDSILADTPGELAVRGELAQTLQERMPVLMDAGRIQDADEARERSVSIFRELIAAGEEYREQLAIAFNKGAIVLRTRGRIPEALEALREGQEVLANLLIDDPGNPIYRWRRALNFNEIGRCHREPENQEFFEKAFRIVQELTREHPTDEHYRQNVLIFGSNVFASNALQGRPEEGRPALDAAIAAGEQLVADFPRIASYRDHLARAYTNLGALLGARGENEARLSTLARTIRLREELISLDPANPQYKTSLAHLEDARAQALFALDRAGEALEGLDRAVADSRVSLAAFPGDREVRAVANGLHMTVHEAHLRSGDLDRALQGVREFPAPASKRDHLRLIELYVSADRVVRDADGLTPEQRAERRANLAANAAASLRSVMDGDVTGAEFLSEDSSWLPFLENPEFQALIDRLRAKSE